MPRHFHSHLLTTVLGFGLLFPNPASPLNSAVQADEKPAAPAAKPEDTAEVKLKDLTLKLPKSWTVAESTSTMRLATYNVPAVEGDPEPGELTVFNFAGGGGDLASNLTRWIDQFDANGRKATIKKGKVGTDTYYLADITGTYKKPKGPPVLRQTEAAPGFRMLAVVIELEGKGVYYLKLAGPDATIKAQSETLRAAFGGKSADETDYEI